MTPMFIFLASSFNVELVYIILKGVTQFSYLAGLQKGNQDQNGEKSFLVEDQLN